MGSLLAGQKMRASALQITTSRYYSNDTTTTLAGSGTRTFLNYAVTDSSNANVTANSSSLFTLNKDGIWIVECSTRFFFNSGLPTTGDVILEITGPSGTPVEGGRTVPTPIPLSGIPEACTIREYTAGSQIQVRLSNFTDKTLTVACNAIIRDHISFTWLQGA